MTGLFGILISLFVVSLAMASVDTKVEVSNNGEGASSDVKVETNTGQNTICQNGKCTTTSNNGKSTSNVCINGKCYTSEGDLHVQSEDGKSKVDINTDTGSNESGNSTDEEKTNVTTTPEPTPDDEIRKEVEKKVAEQRNIFEQIAQSIRDFFKSLKLF